MDLCVGRVFQPDCFGLASRTGHDRVPRRAVAVDKYCGCLGSLPLSDEERKALKPPVFLAPSALAAVVIVRFGFLK